MYIFGRAEWDSYKVIALSIYQLQLYTFKATIIKTIWGKCVFPKIYEELKLCSVPGLSHAIRKDLHFCFCLAQQGKKHLSPYQNYDNLSL